MEVNGNRIILDAGEEIAIKVREKGTASAPGIEPYPEPVNPKDKGRLKYKVGLLSDLHFDSEDSHNSEYIQDFINAIGFFRKNDVEFLCNAGDLCQYNDMDLELYKNYYTAYAWAPTNAGLRIFTALGNHDYLRLFSNGQELGKLVNCFNVFTGEDYWRQYGYQKKTDYIQFLEYDGNWNEQQYGPGRTTKSKLSYWVEMHGDIYVFLSVDYGVQANPRVWDWLARGMNLLDQKDPYVKQMEAYVVDTLYDYSCEKRFNYQFFHPNALIWLKDILENNHDRRVFVFTHHFLPNKAGDTFGDYSRLRIWPYSESPAVQQKYYSGSNTVCGLTFWFLDKLMRQHTNAIWFSGHSHYEWKAQEDCITRAYDVLQPSGAEVTPLVDDLNTLKDSEYDYRLYTPVGHSYADCAPSIHLPSLSKPTSREGQSLYGASQGGIMEVYEHGVTIQCYAFKDAGYKDYRNEIVKTIEL